MRRSSELALKTLEIIGRIALGTATLMEAILTTPYGASYSTLQKNIAEIERRRRKCSIETQRRHQFYDLLYRLKRDGLIERRIRKGSERWGITAKGKKQLLIWKNRHNDGLPRAEYPQEESKELKIVVFDIPERQKRKRVWLRHALRRLGFKMLQKSVWLGKQKLPEEFLRDLKDLSLLSYVEMFAVTKTGSLRHL